MLRSLFAGLLAAVLAGCDGDGSASYRDGCAAFADGDLVAARKGFSECIERAPANVDAFLMLARTELRAGEIPAACAAVARAEELAGGDPDVLELSAQVAFQAEDYKKARAAFAKLAAFAGGDPKTRAEIQSRGHAGLGVVEYARITAPVEEGRARAQTEFMTAVRLDFRNASAHYHLARLYCDMFEFLELAKSEFELFVRLSPDGDERARRVAGSMLPELQGRIEAKLQQRAGSGQRDPAACTALLARADAAMAKGRAKSEARSLYASAFAADPLSAPAALGLARCAETPRDALKHYQDACEINPSSSAMLVALGDAAIKAGSPALAERAFSRAVAAGPKSAEAVKRLVAALRKNGKGRVADVYQRYGESLSVGRP